MKIYFDIETRSFARTYNQNRALEMGIDTVAGAGIGALASRIGLKKKAKKLGIERGSKEYKALAKRRMMRGAGIGAATGLMMDIGANAAVSAGAKSLYGKSRRQLYNEKFGLQ